MTIKKKVDQKNKNFISKGGSVTSDKITQRYTKVLVRFPEELLCVIDEAILEKPWQSRNAWLVEAAFEKLERSIDI